MFSHLRIMDKDAPVSTSMFVAESFSFTVTTSGLLRVSCKLKVHMIQMYHSRNRHQQPLGESSSMCDSDSVCLLQAGLLLLR